MSNSYLRFFPIFFSFIYIGFTVFLYYFGPLEWPGAEKFSVFGFMVGATLFFLVGFLLVQKVNLRLNRKRLSFVEVRLLIKYGFFLNFITVPLAIFTYTGKLPWDALSSLKDQGEIYSDFHEHITNYDKGVKEYFYVLIRTFLFPMIVGGVLLGMYRWSELSVRYKFYLLATVALQIILSLSRGTDKEIVDLIVFLTASSIASLLKSKSFSWKYLAAFAFILISFFVLFTDRRDARYSGDLPNCFTVVQVCQSEDNVFYQSGFTKYFTGFSMLSAYVTQGYEGLNIAFEIDHDYLYGIGSSPSLMRLISSISGMNLYERTINARFETSGWHDKYLWSSMYTWLANDFGFGFVWFEMFFFGILFSLAWKSFLLRGDERSFIVFTFCFYAVVYSPVNFQLGVSLDWLFAWLFWLSIWLFNLRSPFNLLLRRKRVL